VEDPEEDAKAEAMMKSQGVPWMVRKILMQIKPERKAYEEVAADGSKTLVLASKSMSGEFIPAKCISGWTHHSEFFGYKFETVVTWLAGGVLRVENHVYDKAKRKTTVTDTWVEGGKLMVRQSAEADSYQLVFENQGPI